MNVALRLVLSLTALLGTVSLFAQDSLAVKGMLNDTLVLQNATVTAKSREQKLREGAFAVGALNIRLQASTLQSLTQAIKLAPGNAFLYYNRGNAYVQCVDYQLACDDYTKAIELDPLMAEAWFNRGLVRMALKQQAEATSDLSKAGELGLYQAYSILKRQRK